MAAIQKAVVDAGPLFSILVLNYSITLQPRAAAAVIERSRISPYLRSSAERASMVQLFDGIQTILTSAHVIAEVQGLQGFKGAYHQEFWLFAMTWLVSKSLDERLIRLLELNQNPRSRDAVCKIGPTDTGLLEIALREGTVLLTDDRHTLAPIAWAQGIDCRLVATLL